MAEQPEQQSQEPEKRKRRKRRRRKRTDIRREFTYLPNLITMGRIGLIPLILYFMDNYSPVRSFVATLIYLGAAVSDSLDGYLARRMGQVSVLGKFLDPLADKLIVTSVLVYLSAMDRCPPWLVVALLARELAVTGLRAIAISEGLVISASDSGKQKTVLQLVGTMFLLLHFRYPILWLTFNDEKVIIDFHAVGYYTLLLALVMSVLSAADYFLGFVRAVKARARESAAPSAQTELPLEIKTEPPPESK